MPIDGNTYAQGSSVTVLGSGSLSKTGSTFAGWNTAANGNGAAYAAAASFSMGSTAVTLYAKWTINSYTVSFNPNGGSAVTSQSIAYNSTATTPTAPTKTGSTFVGWYSDSGLATSFSFSTAITADTTLNAKWTTNNYTVSFNSNGGSGTMTAQSANVATNLTANSFTRSGYTFSGWKTGTGGTGTAYANSASYAFAADVTLYAQWTAIPIPPDTYSVTYNGNGSTSGSMPIDGNTYAYSALVTVLGSGSLTKTGATFAGWNTAANGNGTAYAAAATFRMGIGPVTLYAQWTGNNYSITATASPTVGGTVMCSPNPVNYNASSTCTATPATGYAFTGWSGDCSGTTISTCTLSQVMTNKSVTGTFKGISVLILSASPAAQALSGQTTTLTAQVSGVAGVPGGSISFLDGTNLLGSATLDGSGGAIFASNLPIGTYSLLARYAGNTVYLAGQSSAMSYLVASKMPTTVRISTTPNLSQIGHSVTVHVMASAVPPANPGAGEVTGTVDVSGDGQTCSLTLPASSCALTFSSNGRKRLNATYSGNTFYSPSSGTSVHFVGKRPSVNSAILLLLD